MPEDKIHHPVIAGFLDKTGMTRKQLAAETGLCYPYVCGILSFTFSCGSTAAEKLSKVIGCQTEDLMNYNFLSRSFEHPESRKVEKAREEAEAYYREMTYLRLVGEHTKQQINDGLRKLMHKIKKHLTARQLKVLWWHYGYSFTFRELGKMLNISPGRVGQIRGEALNKLCWVLKEEREHG